MFRKGAEPMRVQVSKRNAAYCKWRSASKEHFRISAGIQQKRSIAAGSPFELEERCIMSGGMPGKIAAMCAHISPKALLYILPKLFKASF